MFIFLNLRFKFFILDYLNKKMESTPPVVVVEDNVKDTNVVKDEKKPKKVKDTKKTEVVEETVKSEEMVVEEKVEDIVEDEELLDDLEERSTDGSDDGEDLKSFIVEEVDEKSFVESDHEDEVPAVPEILVPKASTVVGGRVLRDRTTIKKPEQYFDVATYRALNQKDDIRDMVRCILKWNESGLFKLDRVVTNKTPFAELKEIYRKAKKDMALSDSDDEDVTTEEEADESYNSTEDESTESESDETESDTDDDDESTSNKKRRLE